MSIEGEKSRRLVILNQAANYLTVGLANAFTRELDSVTLITGSVHVQGERIEGTLKEPKPLNISENDTVRYENFVTYLPSFGDDNLFAQLENKNVTVSAEPESDSNWWYILAFVLPLIFFGFIAYVFFQRFKAQGQGFFNIGKSKAKLQ